MQILYLGSLGMYNFKSKTVPGNVYFCPFNKKEFLCLLQVEGKEDAGLGVKTVLPWILLHKLIVYEESKFESETDPASIPGSLEFLCSAHDYLGPLGLCTIESGQILRLLIDKTVHCLFKVSGKKPLADHLTKHLDQVS